MNLTYIKHKCNKCGFEDELPVVSGVIQCPYCDYKQSIWIDDDIPDRQKRLETKNKIKRKLLRYGREYD